MTVRPAQVGPGSATVRVHLSSIGTVRPGPGVWQPAQVQILIVEDDDAIARPLAKGLEREGLEVDRVETGNDALIKSKGTDFDVVLLDLGLPDRDGFDVCRELRARSDVPIIVVTARSEEVDRVVGLELGADDYIVKPFGIRELVARIRAVVRRRAPVSAGAGHDETGTPASNGHANGHANGHTNGHGDSHGSVVDDSVEKFKIFPDQFKSGGWFEKHESELECQIQLLQDRDSSQILFHGDLLVKRLQSLLGSRLQPHINEVKTCRAHFRE